MILPDHAQVLRAAMPPRESRFTREQQLADLTMRLGALKVRMQSRLSHQAERQILYEAKRIVAELETIPEQQTTPAMVPTGDGQSTRPTRSPHHV